MRADYFQSTAKINSMCDTRHLGLMGAATFDKWDFLSQD